MKWPGRFGTAPTNGNESADLDWTAIQSVNGVSSLLISRSLTSGPAATFVDFLAELRWNRLRRAYNIRGTP
jgi:hypothetical protein